MWNLISSLMLYHFCDCFWLHCQLELNLSVRHTFFFLTPQNAEWHAGQIHEESLWRDAATERHQDGSAGDFHSVTGKKNPFFSIMWLTCVYRWTSRDRHIVPQIPCFPGISWRQPRQPRPLIQRQRRLFLWPHRVQPGHGHRVEEAQEHRRQGPHHHRAKPGQHCAGIVNDQIVG